MLSRDDMKKRIDKKGWTVESVYKEEVGYIASCKNGHNMKIPFSRINQLVECPYCRGMKSTVEMVVNKAFEQGFTLIDYKESIDPAGNVYIKKGDKLTLKCKNGHLQPSTAYLVMNNEAVCKVCDSKRPVTTYSRSEEIIAGVLDHCQIRYTREALTTPELGQLKLDFLLPDRKVIIEYAGRQHVYGRTTDTQPLSDVIARDELKNRYARAQGFKMVRIDHTNTGKQIIYTLAKEFPNFGIDPKDPFYDELVQRVFDYGHEMFGWDSYEKIKSYANTALNEGVREASRLLDRDAGNLSRDVVTVFGKRGTD